MGAVCFLSGDRYPHDRHVEDALRLRLPELGAGWITQAELLPPGCVAPPLSIHARIRRLRDILPPGASREAIIIGRSSGARVGTTFAARYGARAAICLGYPFRRPDGVLEPERFVHLAAISVPTLIIQGMHDPYGGTDITENYPLSERVSLRFIRAGHGLVLEPSQWDDVAETIRSFLGSVAAGTRYTSHGFDEVFYLARHPDVAAAVRSGQWPSGAAHYLACGRAAKRVYRLLLD